MEKAPVNLAPAPAPSSSSPQPLTGSKRKAEEAVDPLCAKRITKELRDLMASNTRESMGMTFELVDEAVFTRWRAKWYYDMAGTKDASETQNRLAEQLKERGLDHIEFRMIFPAAYPREAPFVYNHFPRLKGSYIFGQGGLCAQTLSTEHGWSCASRASMLMLTVRSLLENAGCRLQDENDVRDKAQLDKPFDEAGARKDFGAIANIHKSGWHGSAGKS